MCGRSEPEPEPEPQPDQVDVDAPGIDTSQLEALQKEMEALSKTSKVLGVVITGACNHSALGVALSF